MDSGLALTIDNCLIANLSASSAVIVATAASVRVTDTTIRGSGNSALELWAGAHATVTRATLSGNAGSGVSVGGVNGSATSSADIIDSTLDGNGNGVMAWSTGSVLQEVKVSIRNSRIFRNQNYGLYAQNDGLRSTISASNNIISGNGTGIGTANAGTRIWASANTVTHNDRGIDIATFPGGIFESTGDNPVRNNRLGDVLGTITVIGPI
jgi:hypothetical protein